MVRSRRTGSSISRSPPRAPSAWSVRARRGWSCGTLVARRRRPALRGAGRSVPGAGARRRPRLPPAPRLPGGRRALRRGLAPGAARRLRRPDEAAALARKLARQGYAALVIAISTSLSPSGLTRRRFRTAGIHRRRRHLAVERRQHHVGGLDRDALLRLFGLRADVRRGDDPAGARSVHGGGSAPPRRRRARRRRAFPPRGPRAGRLRRRARRDRS